MATKTETTKSLEAKMAEAAAECSYVKKDGTNDFQNYSYARAEDVIQRVNRALSSRGICVNVTSTLAEYHPSSEKGVATRAVVHIALEFTDGTGEVVSQGFGEGSDKGDKAIMKASTAAYKYALAHGLIIAWGSEDPEADTNTDRADSGKPERATKAAPATPQEDPVNLRARIHAAETLEVLEGLRESVAGIPRNDPNRAQLAKVFNEKKKELSA
jgi:hypothetical protein